MFGKKQTRQSWLGMAIFALAASKVLGLAAGAVQSIRRRIAVRQGLDAAGFSAKDRFDLYADLELARENERRSRVLAGKRFATEAS